MHRWICIGIIFFMTYGLAAQNRVGIQSGYLMNYTAIAEYERIDRTDFLLDSVELNKTTGFVHVALFAETGIGKGFFLHTAFFYQRKGMDEVRFTDEEGYIWSSVARQHYIGIREMIAYRGAFRNGKLGWRVATGLGVGFAVGTPNGGALFSGPLYRFLMPFCRYNQVDMGWVTEAGISYRIGPGDLECKLGFEYGLSDVLEDAWIIGRPMTGSVTLGYSIPL